MPRKTVRRRLRLKPQTKYRLKRILVRHEKIVRRQSSQLKKALSELDKRALQLDFSDAALRRQTDVLESVMNNIGDGVVVADEKGKLILFNPAAKDLIGMGSSQISPREWSRKYGCYLEDRITLYPAEDLPLARAMRGESVDNARVYIKNRKKPEGVWVSVNARPIFDKNGALRGGVVAFRDITDQQKAEDELLQSRNHLENIINSIADPIFVKDRQHRCVMVNDAYCKFIGYPRAALLNRTAFDFFPKSEAQIYHAKDELVFRTGQENVNEEEFTDAHGAVHTIVTKKTLYSDIGGNQYIVGIIRDITERKKNEQDLLLKTTELARSNAEREQLELFTYVASHDLKAPLQKIVAISDVLNASSVDEKTRNYLQRMQNAALQLSRLIDDLVQFARVATLKEANETVSLSDTVKEVLFDNEETLTATGAEIEVGKLPVITANKLQMKLLFQNLIGNALKFSRPEAKPRVRITAKPPADHMVEISVEDNGIGFEPGFSEKIFAPFERLHNRSKFEGSGLGLAICRKIVEAHGGKIKAQSIAGKSTIITVLLPSRRK